MFSVTDHQLCYTVGTASGFTLPGTITLKNQFSPKGFNPTPSPRRLVLHWQTG